MWCLGQLIGTKREAKASGPWPRSSSRWESEVHSNLLFRLKKAPARAVHTPWTPQEAPHVGSPTEPTEAGGTWPGAPYPSGPEVPHPSPRDLPLAGTGGCPEWKLLPSGLHGLAVGGAMQAVLPSGPRGTYTTGPAGTTGTWARASTSGLRPQPTLPVPEPSRCFRLLD